MRENAIENRVRMPKYMEILKKKNVTITIH